MSEKLYIIYKFTSPSGKSYIGQTCNFTRRKNEHKIMTGCRAFASAIKKYGFETFIEEILEENLTLDEANAREFYWIEKEDTISPNGYNLRTGGKNYKCSDEMLAKMSGKNHHMYGKIKELSPTYGRKHTEETLCKFRIINAGSNNPNWGKIGINSKKSKKYIITHPDGNEEIIISLNNFCKNYGLDQGAMTRVSTNKQSIHKGFKCRHYTE